MSSPSRASHVNSSGSRVGETEESRKTEDYRGLGLLALKQLVSMKLEQKRLVSMKLEQKLNHGRSKSHNGSAATSLAKRNRSPCQQDDHSHPQKEKDDNSHGGKKARYIMAPDLPEEIWHHIHSLVLMRDAARADCVSRSFLNSWRCHQNLTFTNETMCSKETLLKGTTDPNYRRNRREYNNNIDRILEKHRDVGVKTFELVFYGPYNTKSYNRLNNWLQIAITPVMEKLTLTLSSEKAKYEFPCSLLSDRSGNTIRHLDLANCILHPTVNLNLRCLTVLDLYEVRITGGGLGCLLSNSFALEKLRLLHCHDMVRLEVPCLLQRLSHLEVFECPGLQVIENKAPNISSFEYTGDEVVQISLGESMQVKYLRLDHRCAISHAIDKLSSSVPNLETLIIISPREIVNAPMIPSKFLHLMTLSITIRRWWSLNMEYDFLSLVSFLDACPSLENFVLFVSAEAKYDLFVGDPSTLRQMPEHHHDKLKSVQITGFCPQKSLVELTRHILESSVSIKCLILDTIRVNHRCFGNISRKCSTLVKEYIKKACESIVAIKTYIEGVVPSTARLHVLGPCSRCHAL